MLEFATFSDMTKSELHIQLVMFRKNFADAACEKQFAIKNTYKKDLIKNWLLTGSPTAIISAAQSITQKAHAIYVTGDGLQLTELARRLLDHDIIEGVTVQFQPQSR